jgi:lipid-binding SYLF domain-containing protein
VKRRSAIGLLVLPAIARSRGLFAGVSLEGSTLRADADANEVVYGRRIEARDIVRAASVAVPKGAEPLVELLNRRSPTNLSNCPPQ